MPTDKKNKKRDEQDLLPIPPDGGWGWVVVFGSFMIHVIADGVAYSFGIFYIEFLDYFKGGRGETGWIGSLMVGITWGSGKFTSKGHGYVENCQNRPTIEKSWNFFSKMCGNPKEVYFTEPSTNGQFLFSFFNFYKPEHIWCYSLTFYVRV